MSEEDLPEGWSVAKIDDLLQPGGLFDGPFGSNLKTADYTDAGVRVVRLENLANLSFVEGKRTFISRTKYESLRKHTVVAGDILFGSFVDGLPRVCIVPQLETPAIAKADCFCIRTRADAMDCSFLTYQLGRSSVRDTLTEEIHGATRPRITTKQLRDLQVMVPPLAEQHRIAERVEMLLAHLNATHSRLARISAVLKRFRQAVLAAATSGKLTQEWLREPSSSENALHPEVLLEHGEWASEILPERWRWTSFEESFVDLTDSKRKLRQKDYEPAGVYPVIDQGEELVGGFTSRADLVSKASPPAIVFGDHTRCVKWIEVPFVQGADGVRVLLPREDVLSARYAFFALKACGLPDKGYSRHMRFLRATMFPRPPIDEQDEIVRRIDALYRVADAIEKHVAAATTVTEKLRQAILARALRGNLVPTEAELASREGRDYEPASALLSRIRLERNGPARGPKERGGLWTRDGKR